MSGPIQNTLGGRKSAAGVQAIFNPRTLLLLIILGIFSFGAYFTLSGFSGDLKSGNNGGGHALSKSAIGYGGLLHLLKQNGKQVELSRSYVLRGTKRYQVRILTLTSGWFSNDIDEMVLDTPTLIILPKWQTRKHPSQRGWVQKLNAPNKDIVSLKRIARLLEDVVGKVEVGRSASHGEKLTIPPSAWLETDEDINFYNFGQLQTISGVDLVPVIVSNKGTLLALEPDLNIYILSDPDFLNTYGLANPDRAEFAWAIMQKLEDKTKSSGFLFDLSLHGFVRSQNLIKLALTPPFLAATLCLLAMGVLIAWQAVARFGDPAVTRRQIAMGKLSLIINAAGFIKLAGREYKMAPAYAELTKNIARDTLHISTALSETELDKRLDLYAKYARAETSWTELDRTKNQPKNAGDLLQNAQKLYQWRGDITHERN